MLKSMGILSVALVLLPALLRGQTLEPFNSAWPRPIETTDPDEFRREVIKQQLALTAVQSYLEQDLEPQSARPEESFLKELLVHVEKNAGELAGIQPEDFARAASSFIDNIDDLRLTAKAVFDHSRYLPASCSDGGEQRTNPWQQETVRRGLEAFELVGRQWMRTQAELRGGVRGDRVEALKELESQLLKLFQRHEGEILTRSISGELGELCQKIRSELESGKLEAALQYSEELARTNTRRATECFIGFLEKTSKVVAVQTCSEMANMPSSLARSFGERPDCADRVGNLQELFQQASESRVVIKADASEAELQNEALIGWLKEQGFAFRKLLLAANVVSGDPASINLQGSSLQDALLALGRKVAEIARAVPNDDKVKSLTVAARVLGVREKGLQEFRQRIFSDTATLSEEERGFKQTLEQLGVVSREAFSSGNFQAIQERANRAIERLKEAVLLHDGHTLWNSNDGGVELGMRLPQFSAVGDSFFGRLEVVVSLNDHRFYTGFRSSYEISLNVGSIVEELDQELKRLTFELDKNASDFLSRLGLPRNAVDGAVLSFARGIRVDLLKTCLAIGIASEPSFPECETAPSLLELLAGGSIEEQIRSIVKQQLRKEMATVAHELPKWAGFEPAALRNAISRLPIVQTAASYEVYIPGSLLRPGSDSRLAVFIKKTGEVEWDLNVGLMDSVLAAQGIADFLELERLENGLLKVHLLRAGSRLAEIGSARIQDGRLVIRAGPFCSVPIGGGFHLSCVGGTITTAPRALSFEEVQIKDTLDRFPSTSISILLTDSADGVGFELSESSREDLRTAAIRWLSGFGLDSLAGIVESVGVSYGGFEIEFDDPGTLANCVNKLPKPLDQDWFTRIDQSLLASCALDAAKNVVPDELTTLLSVLRNDLPRLDGFSDEAELELGPAGKIRYKCDGQARQGEAYTDCRVAIDSAILNCDELVDVTFRVGSQPEQDLNRRCVEEWIGNQVRLPSIDSKLEVSVVGVELLKDLSGVRIELSASLSRVKIPIAAELGFDGNISIDHTTVSDLAKQLRKQYEERIREDIGKRGRELLESLEAEFREFGVRSGLTIERTAWLCPGRRSCKAEEGPTGALLNVEYSQAGGITVENVILTLQKGLDFSRARVDSAELERIKKTLLERLQITNQNFSLAVSSVGATTEGVTVHLEAAVGIPSLGVHLETPVQVEISERFEVKEADLRGLILQPLLTNLMERVKGLPTHTGNWSLDLQRGSIEGDRLRLIGEAKLTAFPKISAEMSVDLSVRDGKVSFSQPKLNPNLDAVVGPLIEEGLGGLLADNKWISVQLRRPDGIKLLLGKDGQLPKGVVISLVASLLEIGIPLPEIIVDSGIRLGELKQISVTSPVMIPLLPSPFGIKNAGADFDLGKKEIIARGDIVLATDERGLIAQYKGRYTFSLKTPHRWRSQGKLVILLFFPLGEKTGLVDLAVPLVQQEVHIGGALSDLIKFDGMAKFQGKAPQFSAGGRLAVFKVDIAKADLIVGKDEISIKGDAHLGQVIGKASVEFFVRPIFKNPRLKARFDLNVLGIRLVEPTLLVNPRVADLTFKTFGISLGLTVPSWDRLSEDLIKELLLKLLSVSLKDLVKAIEAILQGNFKINPFGSFGPDNGGVTGPGGDDGDSEGGGEGGDGDRSTGVPGDASAADVIPDHPVAEGRPGNVALTTQSEPGANAVDALLMPSGDESLRIVVQGDRLMAQRRKGEGGWTDLAYVKAALGGHSQFQSGGGSFVSSGQVIQWGDLGENGDGYLINALNLTGGERGDGVLYVFGGKANRANAIRVFLKDLEINYLGLGRLADNPGFEKAFKRLLHHLPFLSRRGPGLDSTDSNALDIVEAAFRHRDQALEAICLRYSGDVGYTVYVSDGERSRIAILQDLHVIEAEQEPGKTQFTKLLWRILDEELEWAAMTMIGPEIFVTDAQKVSGWNPAQEDFVTTFSFDSPIRKTKSNEEIGKAEEKDRQLEKKRKRAEKASEAVKLPLFGCEGDCHNFQRKKRGESVSFVLEGSTRAFASAPLKLESSALFECSMEGDCETIGTFVTAGSDSYIHALGPPSRGRLYWHFGMVPKTAFVELKDLGLSYSGLTNVQSQKSAEFVKALKLFLRSVPALVDDVDKPVVPVGAKTVEIGGRQLIWARPTKHELVAFVTHVDDYPWQITLKGDPTLLQDEELLKSALRHMIKVDDDYGYVLQVDGARIIQRPKSVDILSNRPETLGAIAVSGGAWEVRRDWHLEPSLEQALVKALGFALMVRRAGPTNIRLHLVTEPKFIGVWPAQETGSVRVFLIDPTGN